MKFRTMTLAILALVWLGAACGTTGREKKKAQAAKSTAIDVQQIAQQINVDTQTAARRVQVESRDREIRREMIMWQIHTAQATQRALNRPDPRMAFIDIWTRVLLTRSYLQSEPGRREFGAATDDLIAELDRQVARIERRAGEFLSKKQFVAVREAAVNWVDEHPVEGDDLSNSDSFRGSDDDGRVLDVMLAIPEGIFSFGGGVKDTAAGVHEIAGAADRGVAVLSGLPLMIRLQTELMLFTIEENEAVNTLMENSTKVSDSVVSVAKTAETLPERVEEATVNAIRELEKTQPEFQKTLDKGQGIVDQANATVKEISPILDKVEENGKWVDRTVENASKAGTAWEGAFGQLNLLVNPPLDPDEPKPEPSPPFDMKDLAKTAEHATKTAEEVHATVVELRGIIDGKGIDDRLAQVNEVTSSALDGTGALAGDVVDRIAVRAALLIVLFFAMLLGYRFVALRFARAG
ncbi:MAG: hypothetical protein ACYTGZ_06580 [Planctomycetota bacterium]|jgi:hypothetical protein